MFLEEAAAEDKTDSVVFVALLVPRETGMSIF
jgi:hypothetical protein